MLASVENSLGDFNAQSKTRLDLVVFLYAAEHIARISRIIKQPYGNALLVGARPHAHPCGCSLRFEQAHGCRGCTSSELAVAHCC
jgi:hypothetical protein